MKKFVFFLSSSSLGNVCAQPANPLFPDNAKPVEISGMKPVWNDEFNILGKPDTSCWRYETGFVRNQELQWYQTESANCANGV